MKIAVLGGTGVAGRHTVAALRAGGHEVAALSRSTGVDLVTGEGLTKALTGVEAVIDATNVETMKRSEAEAFFAATATSLTRSAQEAGVGHIVALSIVGIERVPFGYYFGKLLQEATLAKSGVPVSILRATQFHDFPGQLLARSKRGPVIVPKWLVQPVSAREVGETLALIATGDPRPMSELAGPQREWMADLVRQTAAALSQPRRVWEVRIPGRAGKALAKGGNTPAGDALRGTQTFSEWLQEQRGARLP